MPRADTQYKKGHDRPGPGRPKGKVGRKKLLVDKMVAAFKKLPPDLQLAIAEEGAVFADRISDAALQNPQYLLSLWNRVLRGRAPHIELAWWRSKLSAPKGVPGASDLPPSITFQVTGGHVVVAVAPPTTALAEPVTLEASAVPAESVRVPLNGDGPAHAP